MLLRKTLFLLLIQILSGWTSYAGGPKRVQEIRITDKTSEKNDADYRVSLGFPIVTKEGVFVERAAYLQDYQHDLSHHELYRYDFSSGETKKVCQINRSNILYLHHQSAHTIGVGGVVVTIEGPSSLAGFSTTTGQRLWELQGDNFHRLYELPNGNVLYFRHPPGGPPYYCSHGSIVGVVDVKSGVTLWETDLKKLGYYDERNSPPLFLMASAYFTVNSNPVKLIILNTQTGQITAEITDPDNMGIAPFHLLGLENDILYTLSKVITAYSATTFKKLWQSSITLDALTIVSTESLFVVTTFGYSKGDNFFVLNKSDGKLISSFGPNLTPGWITSTGKMETNGSSVFFAADIYEPGTLKRRECRLISVNIALGTVEWSHRSECVHMGPILENNLLYIGTADGFLKAIDPKSGSVKWSLRVGESPENKNEEYFLNRPIFQNGKLYTSSHEKLLIIDP